MATVTVTQEMSAPPEKVWTVLTDLSRYAEWLSIHQKWSSELPAQLTQGTRVTEVISVMGMANKIEWTIDEYQAPRIAVLSGTGMAGVKIQFTMSVERIGDGSKASIDVSFTGQMVTGAIGTAVAKAAKKDLEESINTLAGLIG